MSELSPQAQAVLDAIKGELDHAPWELSFLAGSSAAAALRAAADHIPDHQTSAHMLHAIADELENQ